MGEYQKTKHPGIFKYAGPQGEIYGIDFYASGKRHREIIGSTLDEAKKELERRRQLGKKGKYIPEAKKRKLTFDQLVEDYKGPQNENVPKKFYENSLKYCLPVLNESFGGKNLYQIDAEAIKNFRNKRKETPTQYNRPRSGISVNRELEIVRLLLNHALLKGWIEDNPFKRFSDLKQKIFFPEDPRERTLTADEIGRILEASPLWLKNIIRAALLTGLRRNDILSLRWENIDFESKNMRFWEEKKDKWRLKPINSEMVSLLQAIPRNEEGVDGYVFLGRSGKPIPASTVKETFRRVCKKARLLDVHFHDLRRSSGTFLMEMGTPLPVIQKHFDHKKMEQTRLYLGIKEGYERKEIEKLCGLFNGQKSGRNDISENISLENNYGNA